MTDTVDRAEPPAPPFLIRRGREVAAGFLYWLAYVLVLEPGNVMMAGGRGLDWGTEAARMTGAGLLGGAVTPLVIALVRRFPLRPPALRRHALLLLAAIPSLAAVLVALGCVLAAATIGEARPFPVALVQELAGNGPPLAFALSGLVALTHLRAAASPERSAAKPAWIQHVWVQTRSGRERVDLTRVDWIEAQGNYVGLHVGTVTRLVRGTLTDLEAQLDPSRFVRIHRRTIVAIDRVLTIVPLGAGDAELRLEDGAALRVSRNCRPRVTQLLAMRLGARPENPDG